MQCNLSSALPMEHHILLFKEIGPQAVPGNQENRGWANVLSVNALGIKCDKYISVASHYLRRTFNRHRNQHKVSSDSIVNELADMYRSQAVKPVKRGI